MGTNIGIGRLFVLCPGGLLLACANVRITNVWYDRDNPHPPVRKVLILGVAEDPRDRRLFEESMAGAFRRYGVDARPALQVIPVRRQPVRERIVEAVRRDGYDAVMIARVVEAQVKPYYYPPPAEGGYQPPTSYRELWTYYPSDDAERAVSPGRTFEVQRMRLEVNLYDGETNRLIWSAASAVYDPRAGDREAVYGELVGYFLQSLIKARLVSPPSDRGKGE